MPDGRAHRCSPSRACRPGTASRTSCTASTFDVRAGEVVTLLGRNGAGKTTTLKSIMGIVGQRTGSVRFEGRELIGLSSNAIARQGIAFCPEERGIFASLDVEENLYLPPEVKPGGLVDREHFHAVPEHQGAPAQPGHQAFRRRAADAGDRAHPAHRRAAAAARRADRGLGAGHHPADRPHHPHAQGAGFYHPAGGTEFPLRLDGRGPLLRHGTRPRGRRASPIRNWTPTSKSCTSIWGFENSGRSRTG